MTPFAIEGVPTGLRATFDDPRRMQGEAAESLSAPSHAHRHHDGTRSALVPPLRNSAEVHTGEVLGIEPRSARVVDAAVVVGAHADRLAAGAAEGEASDLTTPPPNRS